MSGKIKIKICGITNVEDALLSVTLGADALGFNFYRKSPRCVSPEHTQRITDEIIDDILKVGVFVNEELKEIIKIAKTSGINAAQLHGEEPPEFAERLKRETGLIVIKAFRVSPDFIPEYISRYEVDGILLDAFSKNEYGGTGHTFDWKIAKKVSSIFHRMFLAGGLSPANVADAISTVAPYGIDACSGLENKLGFKDESKLRSFFSEVNGNL